MTSLELDSEQQAIVDYQDSCVVIAGPGSGKTRTLIAKAEKLHSEGNDLICLTFTRSAAKEMRDRAPGINARTIHSYCHSLSGWTGDYEDMLIGLLAAKEKGMFKGDTYDWVLIDEVQDLTPNQWSVTKSLVKDKLFAVGDPYQSIYGWNGALGKGILTELNNLGCKEFQLRNNYRSCSEIVSKLNSWYPRDLESKNTKDLGTTVILARTRKQVEKVSRFLDNKGIGHTVRFGASEYSKTREEFRGDDKLKLMTCHCSKGLEFDKVLLYCWSPEPFDGAYPSNEEFNLYYVSLARASKEFVEVGLLEKEEGDWWSNTPSLLEELKLNGR